MKKTLIRITFAVAILGFFTSCDLEDLELTDSADTIQAIEAAKGAIEENSEAELQVVKVFENVNNYGISEEGKKSAQLAGNPTYSLVGNTLTIDFTGVDQSSGKVIAAFNRFPLPFYQEGLAADVSFDGYKRGGISIDGMFTLTIDKVESSTVKFMMVSDDYMTFTDDANASFDWLCSQSILWAEGYSTISVSSDDKYVVSGSSSQMTEGEINKMLLDEVTFTECEYIVDGSIEVTASEGTANEFIVTTEFGVDANKEDKGECDSWILMNSEGLVENLHIKISAL